MKFNLAKTKRKLDRLFSGYVLARDKRICQWCGKTDGKMDCAHIIPRNILSLRWTPENAVTLCFRCHQIEWHTNPLAAVRWLESRYGSELVNKLLADSTSEFSFNQESAKEIEKRLNQLLDIVSLS